MYSFKLYGPVNPENQYNWVKSVKSWRRTKKRFYGVVINFWTKATGGHWVAFLADEDERTLEFFDSMGKKLSEYALVETHFEFLFDALQSSRPGWKQLTGVGTPEDPQGLQHQRGSTECGLYVIWYLSSRLHGTCRVVLNKTRFPDEAAHVLREVYFSDRNGPLLQGPTGTPPEKQLFDAETLRAIFEPSSPDEVQLIYTIKFRGLGGRSHKSHILIGKT